MFQSAMLGEGIPATEWSVLKHLQLLVQRMPNASTRTRLSRVREEWIEPLEPIMRQEIDRERELWLITELHHRQRGLGATPVITSFGPVFPIPAVKRAARIMDISSSEAELHHLAAVQPSAKIAHLGLTRQPLQAVPPNVVNFPLSQTEPCPLPFADSSYDHIRVINLTGIFDSPTVKMILKECYRILTVRGILELRFIDPYVSCSGPLVTKWVESNILLPLESSFRCTRPRVLLPLWAHEAGFVAVGAESESGHTSGFLQETSLRLAVNETLASDEDKIETEICRDLVVRHFKDLVSSKSSTATFKWPWEEATHQTECVDSGTHFKHLVLFAFKN
jgi:hypothetical protein